MAPSATPSPTFSPSSLSDATLREKVGPGFLSAAAAHARDRSLSLGLPAGRAGLGAKPRWYCGDVQPHPARYGAPRDGWRAPPSLMPPSISPNRRTTCKPAWLPTAPRSSVYHHACAALGYSRGEDLCEEPCHSRWAERSSSPPIVFDMRGAAVTEDLLRQMNSIATGAAVTLVGANNRMAGTRARQRMV